MFHKICIDFKIKQTASETSVSLTILLNFDGLHHGDVESGPVLNELTVINKKVVRV